MDTLDRYPGNNNSNNSIIVKIEVYGMNWKWSLPRKMDFSESKCNCQVSLMMFCFLNILHSFCLSLFSVSLSPSLFCLGLICVHSNISTMKVRRRAIHMHWIIMSPRLWLQRNHTAWMIWSSMWKMNACSLNSSWAHVVYSELWELVLVVACFVLLECIISRCC